MSFLDEPVLFSFDIFLIMIIFAFLVIGYFTGGHKQIRISISLIMPFVIIYYFGRNLAYFIFEYEPYNNFVHGVIGSILPMVKYTMGMMGAYFIMYIVVFVFLWIVSLILSMIIVNESMDIRFGRFNGVIGIVFGLLNAYVLIYFIILPIYGIGMIRDNERVSNFFLDNPPPFTRIGRVASKATDVKSSFDKATAFYELLSPDGIKRYYGYLSDYQTFIDEKDDDFYKDIYGDLSDENQELIDDEMVKLLGYDTTETSSGLTRVLINDYENTQLFEYIYETETEENQVLMDEYYNAVKKYKGLIMWFFDDLNGVTISNDTTSNVSSNELAIGPTIISFMDNYEKIHSNLEDEEVLAKIELFKKAVDVYDVFYYWTDCIQDNATDGVIDSVSLYCTNFDREVSEEDYDLMMTSTNLLSFALEGNNITWIIMQYKQDYEEIRQQFIGEEKILETLDKAYDLVIEYETNYQDLVENLDPDLSLIVRMSIAVIKTKFDVHENMSETPIMATIVNDAAMFCTKEAPSTEDISVEVCETGLREIAAQIIVEAYLIRDENNQTIDKIDIEKLINHLKDGKEKYIYTDEFIILIGDQIAFKVNDETGLTLLDELINDGFIDFEGQDVLYRNRDLFSDQFGDKIESYVR